MSTRGERSGGGQSSLKYLLGSEEQPRDQLPPPPKTVSLPPYGIDIDNHNLLTAPPAATSTTQLIIHPSQPQQHLGNILTNRPSTKVKSVPGGHSSLGYLFGDN